MRNKQVAILGCLAVVAMSVSGELTWTGAQGSAWDTSTLNWLSGGTAAAFAEGDDVRFTDDAANKTVNVTVQKAGTVVFDNSETYILNGGTPDNPQLTDVTRFEKHGSGKLLINGFHSFKGEMLIAGGDVETSAVTNDKDAGSTHTSPLGDPCFARTVTVQNATLALNGLGPLGAGSSGGTGANPWKFLLKMENATLKMTNHQYVAYGDCEFKDTVFDYTYRDKSDWNLFGFHGGSVKFTGSTPFVFNRPADAPSDKGHINFTGREGFTIHVDDITGDADPDVRFLIPFCSGTNLRDYTPGHLRKTGAGTLSFESNVSQLTSTGDWRIEEGTLRCKGNKAHIGKKYGLLGDPSVARNIYVGTNATLHFASADVMGQVYNVGQYSLTIDHGTFKVDDYCPNGVHNLTLDDATLDLGYREEWPTLAFHGFLHIKGSELVTIGPCFNNEKKYAWCFMRPYAELRIDDITGDNAPDVTWLLPFQDGKGVWHSASTNGGDPALHSGAQKCGWTKTGKGTLFFTEDYSTMRQYSYTGDITIREGTVRAAERDAVMRRTKSAYGDMTVPRTITICEEGVLDIVGSDIFGQMACEMAATICVTNGGRIKLSNNQPNSLGNLVVCDGTVDYSDCVSSEWGAFAVGGLWSVSSTGTKPVVFPWNGNERNYITLGFADGQRESDTADEYRITGHTELRIADITGDDAADVVIAPQLRDQRYWTSGVFSPGNSSRRCRYKVWNDGAKTNCCHYTCGIRKTGPGAVVLTADMRATAGYQDTAGSVYSGETLVEAGAVLVDGWIEKSAFTVKRGAFTGGQGTVKDVTLEDGAGFMACTTNTAPLKVTNLAVGPSGVVRVFNPEASEPVAKSVPVCQAASLTGDPSGWPVYINGVLSRKHRVTVSGGLVRVTSGGTVLVLR